MPQLTSRQKRPGKDSDQSAEVTCPLGGGIVVSSQMRSGDYHFCDSLVRKPMK